MNERMYIFVIQVDANVSVSACSPFPKTTNFWINFSKRRIFPNTLQEYLGPKNEQKFCNFNNLQRQSVSNLEFTQCMTPSKIPSTSKEGENRFLKSKILTRNPISRGVAFIASAAASRAPLFLASSSGGLEYVQKYPLVN